MRLVYSSHARLQMTKRNIAACDVEQAMSYPSTQRITASGATRTEGEIGDRTLAVVWHPIRGSTRDRFVRTVFWKGEEDVS